MSRKLIKVAKELNVGLSSIVDHLSSKGFEVENKPNFTVTEDMYTVLLMEFKGSLAVKEKADQIVIGSSRSHSETEEAKKETSPQPDKKRSALEELLKAKSKKATEESVVKEKEDEVSTSEDTVVDNTPADKQDEVELEQITPETKKEEVAEEKTTEPETPEVDKAVNEEKVSEEAKEEVKSNTPGLKIVGKIDLSPKRPKKAEPKQEDVSAKESEAKETETKKETSDEGSKNKPEIGRAHV